ncbi:MAG: Radical domain protein [Herbinix sp.]|jgi:radical SAM enzyme (TIGR01210 family)|nr:Radical domain protein [Herbinix sp.]
MLITELMCKIWEEKRVLYNQIYDKAAEYSDTELFQRVKNKEMTHYSYPGTSMNLLSCSICTYRLNNDFGGCSMCNYENDVLEHQAFMSLLYQKNKKLYAKAIFNSFQNVRGKKASPNIFELISSYDMFNDNEFPEEAFLEFFKYNELFINKPFGYIFEARAGSITKDKLVQIQKYIPKESRVYIEFGVEVGNEWIRNHWLNKGLTNNEIQIAINLIHEAGFKASADILIGIPGLTEEQSITLFIDTVMWLERLGMDQYVVLPLNRKSLTLQGIIYEYLSEDKELMEYGVVQGEHTGIPWLTTIIKAIDILFDINPRIMDKMNLAQVFSYQNSVDNETSYNNKNCSCNQTIRNALWSYQNKRDRSKIKKARIFAESNLHECTQDYINLVNKQSNCKSIPITVQLLMHKLSRNIWTKDYLVKNTLFDEELKNYSF